MAEEKDELDKCPLLILAVPFLRIRRLKASMCIGLGLRVLFVENKNCLDPRRSYRFRVVGDPMDI